MRLFYGGVAFLGDVLPKPPKGTQSSPQGCPRPQGIPKRIHARPRGAPKEPQGYPRDIQGHPKPAQELFLAGALRRCGLGQLTHRYESAQELPTDPQGAPKQPAFMYQLRASAWCACFPGGRFSKGRTFLYWLRAGRRGTLGESLWGPRALKKTAGISGVSPGTTHKNNRNHNNNIPLTRPGGMRASDQIEQVSRTMALPHLKIKMHVVQSQRFHRGTGLAALMAPVNVTKQVPSPAILSRCSSADISDDAKDLQASAQRDETTRNVTGPDNTCSRVLRGVVVTMRPTLWRRPLYPRCYGPRGLGGTGRAS